MSNSFVPQTRLEKILCGVSTTPKRAIEKAVAYAMAHIGNGGGGNASAGPGVMVVNLEEDNSVITSDTEVEDIAAAFREGTPVFLCFNNALMLSVMNVSDSGDSLSIISSGAKFSSSGETVSINYVNLDYSPEAGWTVSGNGSETELATGDRSIYSINVTFDKDQNLNETVTFGSMTAAELFEICKDGRMFRLIGTNNESEVECLCQISATKVVASNNTTVYSFLCRNTEGYYDAELSANDVVVVTKK